MVLDGVVRRGDELIGLVVCHFIYTTPYRSHTVFSPTKVDFNVHQVMPLNLFRFEVLGAVEDQVSGFHLFELQFYRKCVKLIGLITEAQFKSKVLAQIVDSFSDQTTTVKVKNACALGFFIFGATLL